ncbi:oxidoreductase [Rhizorhabdus dicambivorans]|uniref:Oxidoreductase n=1 Tax=Rhizorhabdus dicambivorans TaxID=1850238 RepID=A0A2A4FU36_9SPHN|nr:oxidoreductase [Rhizorhabdus dicambivorans]ATE65617.1 oxidoreductase [Rhizorhabdus dicambivorans]PCE40958.1 oxidoreductase [Rhizorhabdus dicambivorans]
MSDFNYLLLLPAGIAVLLFILLAFILARRVRGEGLEAPDPRPRRHVPPPVAPVAIAPVPPPQAERPPYGAWRLIERILANPDSAGGPLYRLCFTPEGEIPVWRPGAVAHVYCGPAADVLAPGGTAHAPAGEYMIGSLPTEGLLDLVVRLAVGHGVGEQHRSRWLCQGIEVGQQVAIALRDDPAFLPPPDEVPLILIGNAIGIAGLVAHIKARPQGTRNWLIFGDRNSADDRMFAAEVTDWVSSGHLERCDLVFPREGEAQRLVVDQINDSQAPLLDWALAGAAIYVCGSERMGNDVHAAFSRLLGPEALTAMAEAGLYRRSIY